MQFEIRKLDLYIGNRINKTGTDICWCISPKIDRNFLGMDFFDKYKLILVGGKNKRFYITRLDRCVKCKY